MEGMMSRGKRKIAADSAHPHPVWPLCAETETLQPETDTCLAGTLCVWLLIALLLEGDEGDGDGDDTDGDAESDRVG